MSRKRFRVSSATVFFALLSLVLGIALYLQMRRPREVSSPAPLPVRKAPTPRSRVRPTRTTISATPPRPGAIAPPQEPSARIAILIDDLGNDPSAVDRIARWRYPVGAAVLPDLPGSASAARKLESSGKEVLLHLPMEPKGFPSVRPGPGVLLRGQSDDELGHTLEADLQSVPGAVGVNNHMGSAATTDRRVMRVVMRVLSDHRLFFVDSRTTDATVAETEARASGVPTISRRVFLDDVATEEQIERALADLVQHARTEGVAVGIGHPHAATLAVLDRELPHLETRGVRLVNVGELVR